MNARKFTIHQGRITAFDIYTSDTYKSFVLLAATCPTGSPVVRWAAKIIAEAVLDFKPNPVDISIKVFDASSADKNPFTVLQTILPADPKRLMDYLRGLNLTPPDDPKSALDTSTMSVGPCSYLHNGGPQKYVKVRLSGYSVPFVLDENEVSWDRVATKQAIVKSGIGGYLLDRIFNALESKSTYIMQRARTKPLNISMIDEYAKHRLAFYREFAPGQYEPASKEELANPSYKPVLVFELGSLKNFALIEDEMWRIRNFTSRVHFDKGTALMTMSAPVTPAEGFFTLNECTRLDPADEFTIAKIHKCIENKL